MYGTLYRVRFYPPFGYSTLYKEYNLTRFNHQKNATPESLPERLLVLDAFALRRFRSCLDRFRAVSTQHKARMSPVNRVLAQQYHGCIKST